MLAVSRPGIWRRVGLNGVMVGLDLQEALASLGTCDRSVARRHLMRAETAFVAAVLAHGKEGGDG
jgi:hypothetical protein